MRQRRLARFALALLLLLPAQSGCFTERSFAMRLGDFVPAEGIPGPRHLMDARAWLSLTHAQLQGLLPSGDSRALLVEDLTVAGESVKLRQHFGLPSRLDSLLLNLNGIEQSAQVTSDHDSSQLAPPWRGFEDIWIPVEPELRLAGRIGFAARGDADCIVLLPGLLGDNALWRTRDLAVALRNSGLHVLALEPRGFGRTAQRYPDYAYTFGIRDIGDLLVVAEWLQRLPQVRETGLIGFSWSANLALLAAWEDNRAANDPAVSRALAALLRPVSGEPHYRAGIIAFSPVLQFEPLLDKLEKSWSLIANPVLSRLQDGIRARQSERRYVGGAGDLRRLIAQEARRAGLDSPESLSDGYDYLRLLPYRGRTPGPKLERARVPVMIVQAANDPLESAQAVADLLAGLHNPHVAGIILPGGGHNGFSAYCRSYFYSLVLRFFDIAPGPTDDGRLPHSARSSPAPIGEG